MWVLLLWVDPPPDPYGQKPASTQVLTRGGELLRAFLSPDEKWRLRTRLDQMSPHLIRAVLTHEDRFFYRHPGINPFAVVRAVSGNLAEGRVVSGASTITMQLARITRPRRRSWSYKVWQAYRALQYECLYSKDEILEAYLNLCPYGGNIEGVEAASRIYFQKPASELSIAEAALLAVIPQSPSRRHPLRRPAAAKAARDRLILRLREQGRVDLLTATAARAEPLPRIRWSMPFAAPHFAEWAVRTEAVGETGVLRSTIDHETQVRLQRLVRDHVRELEPLGIGQGAAVVLDYANSQILAMVGSADYHDVDSEGQVNGALAPRSPGSTLKPFLYALVFDRGLATPDFMVEDVPLRLGVYEPKNYDRTYRGAMSAGEALRTSRNVPAVWLAGKLQNAGGRGLYGLLREAGVSSINRPSEHYGLSLVLGGGELSLLDLAGLYATLARQGRQMKMAKTVGSQELGEQEISSKDLREQNGGIKDRVSDREKDASGRLFSRESAFMTLNILTKVTRPELDAVWQSGRGQIPIPWKTGTSFGHCDAWSVGIAGNHVVAVWLGNFNGAGVPHLVGSEVAAPLLFDIIEALPGREPGTWDAVPEGLHRREICAVSGAPQGPACPHSRQGDYIPGVSLAAECSVHRKIQVDTATGYAVCSRCRTAGRFSGQTVEWWPNRMARYLRAHKLPTTVVPDHNPSCTALEPGLPPAITHPQEDVVYYIRPGVPMDDQMIALRAAVTRGTHQVFWFLDGTLVWKGPPAKTVFVLPEPGTHHLCVKDDAGRTATRMLRIEAL